MNCSAFATQLAESELFGHVSGAFSGANRDKQGLVDMANQGTLFLDEVGELSPELQPKLLRLLQFGTYYPVGSESEKRVDVRVISATNRTLVQSNDHAPVIPGLRRDLLYRLNTVHLHIPPLRERCEDIPLILHEETQRRTSKLPPLTEEAQRKLAAYQFPGNVRELQSFADKLVLYTEHHAGTISAVSAEMLDNLLYPSGRNGCADVDPMGSLLPDFERGVSRRRAGMSFSLESYLQEVERRIIAQTLDDFAGNVSQTARALGLSRQGLKNKIRRHNL